MKDEKRLTIEELKAQYKALGEEIAQKEKAEAEEKQARLKAEKDARYKEVEESIEHTIELIKNWSKDYGSFNFKNYNYPYLWHIFF